MICMSGLFSCLKKKAGYAGTLSHCLVRQYRDRTGTLKRLRRASNMRPGGLGECSITCTPSCSCAQTVSYLISEVGHCIRKIDKEKKKEPSPSFTCILSSPGLLTTHHIKLKTIQRIKLNVKPPPHHQCQTGKTNEQNRTEEQEQELLY